MSLHSRRTCPHGPCEVQTWPELGLITVSYRLPPAFSLSFSFILPPLPPYTRVPAAPRWPIFVTPPGCTVLKIPAHVPLVNAQNSFQRAVGRCSFLGQGPPRPSTSPPSTASIQNLCIFHRLSTTTFPASLSLPLCA